jgi:chromosome segregation ATPase
VNDELLENIERLEDLMHKKARAESDVEYYKKRMDSDTKELEENPNRSWIKDYIEEDTAEINAAMSKINDILKEIKSYAEARKSNLYKLRALDRLLISKYEDFDTEFEELSEYTREKYSDKLEELKQNLSLFDEVKNLISSNDQLVQCKEKYDKAKKDLEKKIRDRMRELKDTKPNESTQMRHDFVKKYVHECFEEFMSEYYSYENVFGDYMED